ncbi:Protein of unknown function [Gryllus bimaculatus]|nr:Protein of unknown function [Gryllus bimaculatus]
MSLRMADGKSSCVAKHLLQHAISFFRPCFIIIGGVMINRRWKYNYGMRSCHWKKQLLKRY